MRQFHPNPKPRTRINQTDGWFCALWIRFAYYCPLRKKDHALHISSVQSNRRKNLWVKKQFSQQAGQRKISGGMHISSSRCRSGECVTASGTNKIRSSADTSLYYMNNKLARQHTRNRTRTHGGRSQKCDEHTHPLEEKKRHTWRKSSTKAHNILKENARLPSTATCSLINLACSMQSAHTSIHTLYSNIRKSNAYTQTSSWIKNTYLLPGLHGLWRREIDQGSCFDGGAALNVLNLITGCGCNYLYRYSSENGRAAKRLLTLQHWN